ncbi:MAG: hypothetical protein V3W41_14290 [Planctomycetota bacterium]
MSSTSNIVIVRLLIGVTFLTVMASAAVPSAVRHRTQKNSKAILGLVETLRTACEKHRDDTNILAIEFAAPQAGHDWSSTSFHRLSMKQHYEGWNGPYISHPISSSDNPYGGHISLCSDWKHARNLQFEISRQEFGQFLILDHVPQSVARILDAELDGLKDDQKPGNRWERDGSVRWLEFGGRLMIELGVRRR